MMLPPCASAVFNAVSLQLAGLPFPTTTWVALGSCGRAACAGCVAAITRLSVRHRINFNFLIKILMPVWVRVMAQVQEAQPWAVVGAAAQAQVVTAAVVVLGVVGSRVVMSVVLLRLWVVSPRPAVQSRLAVAVRSHGSLDVAWPHGWELLLLLLSTWQWAMVRVMQWQWAKV